MRVFITDCEGPIAKNDNAMELCAHFIPDGEAFFTILSTYDDYLAYVEKKQGYKAGDTLRLILPFLKAFGASDRGIEEYSRAHILLMPGAKESLSYIREKMPTFIISTSYEPYIRALCEVIDFPFADTYCTELKLDQYNLPDEERRFLQQMAMEIIKLPRIEWSEGRNGCVELSAEVKRAIVWLNSLFWEKIFPKLQKELLF